jgi:2-keto-4-pentenoate hydratase/2-oxohepta-3-ene-1,7-dioic acid hydratase in catechol pathway
LDRLNLVIKVSIVNKINIAGTLVTPSKVVCIGRNFAEHIKELGNEVSENMVVFNKPNSAISTVLHSTHEEQLHYEGEICFVYSQGVFTAVGFGLDLTKRALQGKLKEKGLPWERAKSFDGAAVFSEFVTIDDMQCNYEVMLCINDKLTQKGDVSLMIYSPAKILKELQSFMTLEDGDIVMTGTPKGVGVIKASDRFTGSIGCNGEVLVTATWIAK